MYRLSILLLLVVITLFSCTTNSKKTVSTKPSEETKPQDLMFMQRAYPSGEINTRAYRDAIQWKKSQPKINRGATPIWEFVGPTNVGGRIADIEIASSDAQTYYVGAASGGIFKTTNAGATWIPIFDEQEILSIGDIDVSENNNNLLFVGTGEVNAGGGSLAYDGNGVYKSEDAGLTWQSKGLENVGSIGKVIIDPNNDETIFVGAMGPLFRNDINRGVYRSTNGGDDWTKVLFVSDSTGIVDMAIHPVNSNIVYAASWERIRRPNNRQYGGETSRIYRSINGGDSWSELTVGLPSSPSEKGRISIDISQSNPNVLYALYADRNGSIQGVYRTSNGGDSWIEVNSSQLTNVGFHWWFGGIFVDPTDEDVLYNVGFVIEKSIDGGNNWFTAFPGIHVDQHALAFNPSVAGEILLGNDGGLYKSTDNGVSSVKDVTLPITQFYRFHVDAQNENKIYGGSQDNSTIRTVTGSENDWSVINGGDGFQPLVDPTNTNVIYALSQRGNLVKSTNDAASFSLVLSGINPTDRNNWDSPITFDPANSNTLYFGTDRVYKTTDAAANWTAISPDLSNGPYAGNLAFGTVITIDVSPLDSDIIYAGTDDGNVWVTDNGGTTWNLISATLPNRWVTKVLASKIDVNSVYVTFSGYRFGEDFGHVYKSTNLGTSWTDISTDLPDIPINDIVMDGFDNLFLGTDIGVLGSNDDGITWSPVGVNLPAAVVTDMYIHVASNYLYVGTYGRSSYKLDISADVLAVSDFNDLETFSMFPNPASAFVTITFSETLSEETTIIIYTQLGQFVSTIDFEKNSQQIIFDVSELASGIYFIKLKNGIQQKTKKLIVE